MPIPECKSKPIEDLGRKLILIHGAPKCGKCLSGNTLIYDPITKRPRSLQEVVDQKQGKVTTMGLGGVFKATQPSHYFCSGVKPVFRLTTQTGRVIDATANHRRVT